MRLDFPNPEPKGALGRRVVEQRSHAQKLEWMKRVVGCVALLPLLSCAAQPSPPPQQDSLLTVYYFPFDSSAFRKLPPEEFENLNVCSIQRSSSDPLMQKLQHVAEKGAPVAFDSTEVRVKILGLGVPLYVDVNGGVLLEGQREAHQLPPADLRTLTLAVEGFLATVRCPALELDLPF